jgi:hypothetical protein
VAGHADRAGPLAQDPRGPGHIESDDVTQQHSVGLVRRQRGDQGEYGGGSGRLDSAVRRVQTSGG